MILSTTEEHLPTPNQISAQCEGIEQVLHLLLLSDNESLDRETLESPKPQRLSMLSKLNLLGLISLASIALNFRMKKASLAETLDACHRAIEEMHAILESQNMAMQVGIASINIIEDYIRSLA